MVKTLSVCQGSLTLLLTILFANLCYSSDVPKPVPQEVYDEICHEDAISEELHITCNLEPSMLSWVDLNSDGTDEIIVDGNGISRLLQGSGGYPSFLFQLKNNQYVLINEFFGWGIKVSDNKTNGYLDLNEEFKDYYGPEDKKIGWQVSKRFYKFDKAKGEYVSIDENQSDKETNDFIYQYKKLAEEKQKKSSE